MGVLTLISLPLFSGQVSGEGESGSLTFHHPVPDESQQSESVHTARWETRVRHQPGTARFLLHVTFGLVEIPVRAQGTVTGQGETKPLSVL